MNDHILILQERIHNGILVGESDFREFKSAWEGKPGQKKPRLAKKICADIAEGLAAFANSDGGELIVGVEDDGTISGVPHDEEEMAMLLNAVKTHIFKGQQLPMVYAVKANISGQTVLFFQVEKGADEIYQLPDGRVVVRVDRRTIPASVRALQFGKQEAASRRCDRQWVDGATVQDLDNDLINSTASRYLSRLSLTVEKFLQQLDLAQYTTGGLRLRLAALLLFGKDVRKWHPRSQVRFIKIAGTRLLTGSEYNVLSDETTEGNILELIPAAWDALQKYIVADQHLDSNGQFTPHYRFPAEACQEVLVNAIFHRDYGVAAPVEFHVYDDRLEVKSPGPLLSTLLVDDLYAGESRHDSRNVGIARVLKTTRSIREMGEGMKRIMEVMAREGHPKPILYSNTNWFTITLQAI